MSVYHFDCAVMRGHSSSGEILQDDDFKTLTCPAERIPSDFKLKLRALFPDVVPSRKLIIIDKKGNEVNWSWEKIGFNLLNWLKIQFSEGDQIQVFIEPASSHHATPASARISELVAKMNRELHRDPTRSITSEELVARMNRELEN